MGASKAIRRDAQAAMAPGDAVRHVTRAVITNWDGGPTAPVYVVVSQMGVLVFETAIKHSLEASRNCLGVLLIGLERADAEAVPMGDTHKCVLLRSRTTGARIATIEFGTIRGRASDEFVAAIAA